MNRRADDKIEFIMNFTKMYDEKIQTSINRLSEKIDEVMNHLGKIEITINTLEAQSRKTEELVNKHDVAIEALQKQLVKNSAELLNLQKSTGNFNKFLMGILASVAAVFIVNNLRLKDYEPVPSSKIERNAIYRKV